MHMKNDFYDIESKPIVTLEDFYGPKKKLVDKCLVLFSKEIYDSLLSKYECEEIARIGACNGATSIMAFKHGEEKVAFYVSALGSALAGDNVIEANHLCGAYKFVMFGSCGSLDAEKTNNRFIIPTEAYRGDGMSYYFAPASDYINIKNADILADFFTKLNIPFIKGKIWTTDCMLRETVNLFNKRKSEGCIGVDMELAGVQAVCDFYKFELYDFLAAGDVLTEEKYDTTELHTANHSVDKLEIAISLLKLI